MDNTLRDLHYSSYDTKAEFNNCFIIHSYSMLSSPLIVHVQGCSPPQIFSKQQMSPFELCSCCSCHVFSNNFAQFLLLKRVTCPPFFVFTTKTTQPRPQVFSVNGALTCKNAAFLTSLYLAKYKIFLNLVISNLLWRIIRVLLANQNRGNLLNE